MLSGFLFGGSTKETYYFYNAVPVRHPPINLDPRAIRRMQGERKSVLQIDADVFSLNAQDELLRALENSRERLQVCARKLGTTDATKIFIGLSPGSVLR